LSAGTNAPQFVQVKGESFLVNFLSIRFARSFVSLRMTTLR
jgi:hypothetical protein